MVTTEAGAPNASGFLTTWETRVALPERPSFGRNRFRPCEEARLSATRRRLRVAGRARNELEGTSLACGPADGDTGHACGPADDDPLVDAWVGALGRVRAQLARARQWQAWTDEDPARCAADLARREWLSRARVSQLLKLLTLDATLLADLDYPDLAGPVPSELVLRRIAELPEPSAQRARYRAVCRPSAPTSGRT